MASVHVDGGDLLVRLTTLEKLAALHGDLRVPVSAVRSVEVVDDGVHAVRGLRAPGTAWPGGPRIGTWHRHGRRTFAVAYRRRPAIRVRLGDGSPFVHLVISVDAPEAVAAELRAAAR